jgi:hypothetical protein
VRYIHTLRFQALGVEVSCKQSSVVRLGSSPKAESRGKDVLGPSCRYCCLCCSYYYGLVVLDGYRGRRGHDVT